MMKTFKQVWMLFGFVGLAVPAAGKALWHQDFANSQFAVWSALKDPQVVISRHSFKATDRKKRRFSDPTAAVKAVENEKRTMLSWVGVHDWSPKSYEIEKTPQGPRLVIKGTYRDHKKTLVSFIERHLLQEKDQTIIQEILAHPVKNESEVPSGPLVQSFLTGAYQ